MARSRTWTDQQLIDASATERSIAAVLRKLGLVQNGSNNKSVKKHAARLGLRLPKVVAISNAEAQRRHRARNPDYAQTCTSKHQRENPQKWAEYARNRRAVKFKAVGTFSAEDFAALCVSFGNKCLCCDTASAPLTADHVVPLTKGGSNGLENIQPLCGPCNSRKLTKIIDYRSSV